MGRKQREKLLQFVDDLVAQAVAVLTTALQVPEPQAREAANAIARRICEQYAKTYMYVPSAMDFERTERDLEVWRKYGEDGSDGVRRYSRDRVDQLAEEYGVTPQHVYNIVRLQQHIETLSRQGQLPGIPPAKNPRN